MNVCLHRLILGAHPDKEVDHIDGNGLNNRRANLREVTRAQNEHNKRAPRSNTSGQKGVHFHSRDRRWTAQVWIDGKKVHLGTFHDPGEAKRAYEAACKILRGEHHRA